MLPQRIVYDPNAPAEFVIDGSYQVSGIGLVIAGNFTRIDLTPLHSFSTPLLFFFLTLASRHIKQRDSANQ